MSEETRTPVIEFEKFSFQYFSQAEPTLYDIDLKIYKGEKVLIVGPSGSGKSTMGNCLNGLIPFAYKGEIKGSLKVSRRGRVREEGHHPFQCISDSGQRDSLDHRGAGA